MLPLSCTKNSWNKRWHDKVVSGQINDFNLVNTAQLILTLFFPPLLQSFHISFVRFHFVFSGLRCVVLITVLLMVIFMYAFVWKKLNVINEKNTGFSFKTSERKQHLLSLTQMIPLI